MGCASEPHDPPPHATNLGDDPVVPDRTPHCVTGKGTGATVRWTVVGVALLLFARSANPLLFPLLSGDAGNLLMYYAEHRQPGGLLREYAGYVALLPNLLGWVGGALPLPWQPYLWTGVAFAIAVLAHTLPVSRRFAGMLPDARARSLLCVLLAALPLGNYALDTDVAFCTWHLLWIAAFAAIAAPPSTRRGARLECLGLALCLWSNPLCVVLVPAYALRAARTRGFARAHFATLTTFALLPLLLVKAPSSNTPAMGDWLRTTATVLGERVFADALLGTRLRVALAESGASALIWVAAAVVPALCGVAWSRMPADRRGALTLGALLMTAMVGAAVLSRFAHIAAHPEWAQRYVYWPRAFCCSSGLVAVATLWPTLGGAVRRLVVGLIAGGCALQHTANQPHFYDTSAVQSRQLLAFLQRAERWRRSPERGDGATLELRQHHKLVIRR